MASNAALRRGCRAGEEPVTRAELAAILAPIFARLDVFERRSRASFGAPQRTAVLEVARSTAGAIFTAVQLVEHARVDEALAEALLSAAVDSTEPKSIGKFLRKCSTAGDIAGVRVDRGRIDRGALRWQVSRV